MKEPVVRKVVDCVEDTLVEGGRGAEKPLRMVACAAVIKNPWAAMDFVEDLQPQILAHAKVLADILVPRVLGQMGGPDTIEAFGKCAITGTSGEVEHAAGLIHTLHFGNAFRIASRADSFLPFTNKRAGAGTAITIPMTHKEAESKGSRAHFLTLEFSIPDAPAHDEIVVAIGAASGGRPHHRIGDRFNDMKLMGVDQAGRPLETSEDPPAEGQ
ncbi:Amino acid synthesis [Roseovarius azorensis]|uniref:Amino acid synthesis n=1 Tax=Roseovarius azorensis TaxID=1287727 RepID=A0A1H7XYV9_9RHOB|nr:amino acid synthesis family protein [Roseovarius azorensis]SEM39112.1 Amino acid synthesis [Roseovarius azorensis]